MGIGDKISKEDYNRVQDQVFNILGTGTGSFGYGQTLSSGNVTTSNKVGVTQWRNLQYDLITISRYQNGTIPTLPLPEKDNKIKFNSTTEPIDRFEVFVGGLATNRFNIPSFNFEETFRASGEYFGSWNKSLTFFIDVNFANSNAARHFFNMGGKIKFTGSRTGGTEPTPEDDRNSTAFKESIKAQNESWSLLLDDFSAEFGGAPTSLTDSLNGSNYYRCADQFSATPFYTITDDGVYAQNRLTVTASTPGVLDNRSGVASYIRFRVQLIDNHVPINQFAVADGVDGLVAITVTSKDPSGTRYPNNQRFTNYRTSSVIVNSGIPENH